VADRAFGKAVQALSVDVSVYPCANIRDFSTEDLEVFGAILEKYRTDAAEMPASGEVPVDIGSDVAFGYRER
jgi:hypothetical protein